MPTRASAALSVPRALLVALLVMLPLVASCSSDDSGTANDSSSASGGSTDGPACKYTSDGQPAAKKADLPPDHAQASGQVPMTMTTSVGALGLTLDADNAPCTVNSFISLANQGYFDDTRCHRLVTSGIYVLQCGDPSYTGSGGPGYSFDDELTGKETYGKGTLAMANAGPDTNGSQFFIVFQDSPLPPNYTVFGTIDASGLKAIDKVAAAGSDSAFGSSDGHPKTEVKIESVTAAD